MIWQYAWSWAAIGVIGGWLLAIVGPTRYYITTKDVIAGLMLATGILATIVAIVSYVWGV